VVAELMRTVAGLALMLLLSGCDSGGEGPVALRGFRPGPAPDSLAHGERIFNTYCSSCHGLHGTGQGLGPPLLDTLYLAGRLPDQAIYEAVERGVKQTHWNYGAMPKTPRVRRGDVEEIIPYLHWLQQRAGIGTRTAPQAGS
jgi:mono/diheme cytochrome c family protein